MPNPKRRHSNTRTRKRRTHDVMKIMTVGAGTGCPPGTKNPVPHMPHRVCTRCGYYKGKPVLQIKIKESKKKG